MFLENICRFWIWIVCKALLDFGYYLSIMHEYSFSHRDLHSLNSFNYESEVVEAEVMHFTMQKLPPILKVFNVDIVR